MIRIDNLKTDPKKDLMAELYKRVAKHLRVGKEEILSLKILKRSIDARKKPAVFYISSVVVEIANEERFLQNKKIKGISLYQEKIYHLASEIVSPVRPIVVGLGPAGLFSAYLLALAGLRPIVLERGKKATERYKDVQAFFDTGVLDPSSNVQFGEGGAGTFSDGKLQTGVKDKNGRNRFVLKTFVEFGAPEEILWQAKPHIGTDRLIQVVSNMRERICELGGEVHFNTQMTSLLIREEKICGVRGICRGVEREFLSSHVILAIGHSARDTFERLYEQKIPMKAKEFAVGFRIEHPQEMLDRVQYGEVYAGILPVSSYKLVGHPSEDRGVYSFCMCPGGYVVNASSEEGHLAVNGMSNYGRESGNANSAIVVSVGAGEYDLNDPLGALKYQRKIEKAAYEAGGGRIPQQLYGDYIAKRTSTSYGAFSSCHKGKTTFADLNPIFSQEIREAFLGAMDLFEKKIPGYSREDAILSGVESRTSSPVRIPRGEDFMCEIKGLYPCGEGAGYAGGITSAAMDGIKVAEALISALD
ncbi:MAG: FAD-dependent oxidoreductase [Lachnospiraceae bacterium]|nr:FAD-dependent oxidoreductase [Lachnospiraceae bacterium]